MKKVVILLLALIMVLGLMGCSKNNSIEGTWVRVGNIKSDDGFVEEFPLYGDDIFDADVPKIEHNFNQLNPFPGVPEDAHYDGFVFYENGEGYMFSNRNPDFNLDAYYDITYQKKSSSVFLYKKVRDSEVYRLLLEGDYLYQICCDNENDINSLNDIKKLEFYILYVYKRVK